MKTLPWQERPNRKDLIERDLHPRASDAPQQEEADHDHDLTNKTPKRVRITLEDMQRFGWTDLCPKCDLDRIGQYGRANNQNHSEHCRARAYDLLQKEGSEKMRLGESEGRARTLHKCLYGRV